jgi:hypothetical protein
LGGLQNYVNSNVPQLINQVADLSSNVAALSNQVAANSGAIDRNSGLIAALNAALNAQQAMITKLQSINQVWQANFKVVNRTFTELRKKVKFVIPARLVLAPIVVGRG